MIYRYLLPKGKWKICKVSSATFCKLDRTVWKCRCQNKFRPCSLFSIRRPKHKVRMVIIQCYLRSPCGQLVFLQVWGEGEETETDWLLMSCFIDRIIWWRFQIPHMTEWESVHVRWGDICVEKTCGNFALINSTWTQWQNMPQTMKKGYIGCWSLLVNVPFNWPWRRERLGKRPLHFGYLDRFHVMWEQDRKTKVGISLQPPNSRWISATRGLLPFKNQSLHS